MGRPFTLQCLSHSPSASLVLSSRCSPQDSAYEKIYPRRYFVQYRHRMPRLQDGWRGLRALSPCAVMASRDIFLGSGSASTPYWSLQARGDFLNWLGRVYGLRRPCCHTRLQIAALPHLLSAIRRVYLSMHADDSHAGAVLAAHAPRRILQADQHCPFDRCEYPAYTLLSMVSYRTSGRAHYSPEGAPMHALSACASRGCGAL
jgi:hypothetical protein